MAEIHERHAVLTLDSDFTVYRKSGRVPLELIHPAQVSRLFPWSAREPLMAARIAGADVA
jgi:hypothetical protein